MCVVGLQYDHHHNLYERNIHINKAIKQLPLVEYNLVEYKVKMSQIESMTHSQDLTLQRAEHSKFIPFEYRKQNEEGQDVVPSSAEDPFDLERYVSNQKTTFRTAKNEVRNGRKETHWFWFVLPTSPYICNGVEQGSRTNRYFCLRSDEEVVAYLEFEAKGVNLRKNYTTILTEIRNQLKKGKTLEKLFPAKDVPKAISSFCLFQRVAREHSYSEVFDLCTEVLKLDEKNRQNFSLFKKIRNTLLIRSEKSPSSSSKKADNARKIQTMH